MSPHSSESPQDRTLSRSASGHSISSPPILSQAMRAVCCASLLLALGVSQIADAQMGMPPGMGGMGGMPGGMGGMGGMPGHHDILSSHVIISSYHHLHLIMSSGGMPGGMGGMPGGMGGMGGMPSRHAMSCHVISSSSHLIVPCHLISCHHIILTSSCHQVACPEGWAACPEGWVVWVVWGARAARAAVHRSRHRRRRSR
jgi:hypothetical protein